MFLTVRGVHRGVYRQRPTILQRQQYVCLQLQFRSPLVEAIGKEQIHPSLHQLESDRANN
jgi:hypothetical protein